MDLSMELASIEVVVGLIVLLLIAPLLQFWTRKLGLNGMREDMKETRVDMKTLLTNDANQNTRISLVEQSQETLESRIEKVEG